MKILYENGERNKDRILIEVKGSDSLYHIVRSLANQFPDFIRIVEDVEKSSVIVSGDLKIDLEKRQVTLNGKNIFFTAVEFDILSYLASYPGNVFSHRQIYEAVWKKEYYQDTANITAHIGHIRKKMEPDSRHPIYIQTVHGVGYRFAKNDSL